MSTTKHSAYILAAQFSLLFSGAIINFGLGRFLGPALYGQFGVVYAIATILNLLLTPGIMQAVSKFAAEGKNDASAIAGSVLRSQLVIGVVAAAAYFLLAVPIAAALRDPSLALLLKFLAPLVVIYSLTAVYGGYVTGTGRFGRQAAHLIIYSVTRLAATFLFAYFFSVAGAIAALPFAALAALLYFALTSRFKLSSRGVSAIYRFAIPITVFLALLTVFINTDLLLVKVLLQDNVLTGFYTAASAIARIPYFVLTALGMVLLPVVAGRLAEKKNASVFVRDAFRYVALILFPSSLVIAATGTPLAMFLYRSEYAAAGVPLSVLSIGAAALTFTYLFAIVINAAGRPAVTAATALGMVALSAALNVALIPKYGLLGASVANSAVSVLSAFILLAVVYSRLGSPFNYASLARIALASLFVFIVALQIDVQNKFLLPAVYALLGLIYLAALFVLRELRKEDFTRVFSLVPQRLNPFF